MGTVVRFLTAHLDEARKAQIISQMESQTKSEESPVNTSVDSSNSNEGTAKKSRLLSALSYLTAKKKPSEQDEKPEPQMLSED